jgi:hypothetical protein
MLIVLGHQLWCNPANRVRSHVSADACAWFSKSPTGLRFPGRRRAELIGQMAVDPAERAAEDAAFVPAPLDHRGAHALNPGTQPGGW